MTGELRHSRTHHHGDCRAERAAESSSSVSRKHTLHTNAIFYEVVVWHCAGMWKRAARFGTELPVSRVLAWRLLAVAAPAAVAALEYVVSIYNSCHRMPWCKHDTRFTKHTEGQEEKEACFLSEGAQGSSQMGGDCAGTEEPRPKVAPGRVQSNSSNNKSINATLQAGFDIDYTSC